MINVSQLAYDSIKNKHILGTDWKDDILPSLLKNRKWRGKLPKETYHRLPGISSSRLRKFMDNPYNIHLERENPDIFKGTAATSVGSDLHDIMLEDAPWDTDEEIIKKLISEGAKSPRATGDYKKWKKEKLEAGIIIVKPEYRIMLSEWEKTLQEFEVLKHTWDNSRNNREISYFVIDPDTGLLLKFCPDLYLPRTRMMADFKYMAGRRSWRQEVEDDGYHFQQEFYRYGLQLYEDEKISKKFAFIKHEKAPPFTVSIRMIGEIHADHAKRKIPEVLEAMRESYETGDWGKNWTAIVKWSAPSDWWLRENENG